MNRVDELNKEISLEIQISEGKDARHSIKDYFVSKMALAVQKAITTRTEMQASIENMTSAIDTIFDIHTVESEHIRKRSTDIWYDSAEFLGSVDTDIKLALIELGRHFQVKDIRFKQILADIEVMEQFKESADIINAAACAIYKLHSDELHEIRFDA